MSDAFLYPLLLPHMPFTSTSQRTTYHTVVTESEEWFVSQFLTHSYTCKIMCFQLLNDLPTWSQCAAQVHRLRKNVVQWTISS